MGANIKVLVNPPIITVAKDLCTSNLIPLEVAAGTKPKMTKTARNCTFEVVIIKVFTQKLIFKSKDLSVKFIL